MRKLLRGRAGRVLTVALAFVVVAVLIAAALAATRLMNTAAANTVYVSPSGDDANPGSEDRPWRTIQHAADKLEPGDTAIVQPGDYGERVHVTRSGSDGLPVVFKANGKVTMKGFTVEANLITVDGFYITGAPDDNVDGFGVYVEGSHNTIENNYLYYNVRGGVILNAPADSPSQTSYNIVRDNSMDRNALTGVDIRGANNTVEHNDIWATIQHHPDWKNAPGWVDADGIRFHGGGHIIRNNIIHDISYSQPENVDPHIDCFQTWADDSHEVAHDVTIEGNFCKNLQSHGKNENGQGFMIEGNTRNLVIKNNVIVAYMGVNARDASGLQIVNNTFVGSLQFTELWPRGVHLVDSAGATVRNNIFYDVGSTGNAYLEADGSSENDLSAGKNVVYMSDGREPPGEPRPDDLWNVDPQFVNAPADDYHLKANSPAEGLGALP